MRLHINGAACNFFEGQTILQVAGENNIFIPTLCFGEGLAPSGSCGICIVEVEGKLLRACATAARDGMEIFTDSPAVTASRKTLLELTLSAHSGDCVAPCKIACPAQTDCQGFIALIAAGKFREAVELMHDAHPFPASISRICPRPCEEKCRRKLKDEAINIAGIKRFAADYLISSEQFIAPTIAPETGRSAAIVGGGPAGLTAAFFLKKAGYAVAVFEAMPKFGGLLRYGIPEYRLPKAILDAEIGALERMGISLFPGVAIGRDLALEFLQKRYDAVIISVGAGVSKPIMCKGENFAGVLGGIDFLKAAAENRPPKIGRRVVVIGGSNTAMDAARTARRLGADVTVAYRRTRDEMPAEKIEIEEALAEGVQFNFLAAPLEILAENDRVTGIKLQKMTLGEPDASGRRSPVPVEGGEETLAADTIIAAIGQDVTTAGLNPLENLKVDENFRTNLPGVFAIGDATGKSWYAIDAIGHGRKVAEIVAAGISEQLPEILVREESPTLPEVSTASRQNAAHNTPEDVRGNFAPVQAELSPAEVAAEAARCLSCGCPDFFECKLVALANLYGAKSDKFSEKFHKRPKHEIDFSNFYFRRDMNKCVLCGLCVAACSAKPGEGEAISATNRGFDTTIAAAFNSPLQNRDECRLCGNCVSRCPVGALVETSPLPKPLVTREDICETTCTLCGNGCGVKIATKAGEILRCLPASDGLCENGRFGFLNFGEKIVTPLVRRDGILRRATLRDAAKAVREGLNVLTAQYGAESIGIAVSPRYVNEDIAAICDFATRIGTPHVFTFADVADEAADSLASEDAHTNSGDSPETDSSNRKKTYCNTLGLKNFGVSTENFLQKIHAGEIKGLVVFGDDIPAEIAPLEFLAVQAAYTAKITSKPARDALVVLPAPGFGEVSGMIYSRRHATSHTLEVQAIFCRDDEAETVPRLIALESPVNAALPPACGFQTRELVQML
ncbi:MAG: FAD-dependent oxidoreductase [Defluviitaleaceae bacterium]|nr:FAD-dependent oxidoreductase [Defluviitaleaceae bacterium]